MTDGCIVYRLTAVLTDNSDLLDPARNRLTNVCPDARAIPGALKLVAAAILAVSLIAGCAPPETSEPMERVSWADSMLSTLSLEEKVGQMLMVDLPISGSMEDGEARDALRQRLDETQAGGVILFAADPVQTGLHVSWAQRVADIPLLVSLDAEWGAGYRLEGLHRIPDAMAIAATGNPQNARYSGQLTAREAASAGVNVLFAPTVDVNVNPKNPVIGTRAWSDDADTVSVYAGAFVQGVLDEGLLPVLKHFPGHGGTSSDSHLDLPIARSSQSELDAVHLLPFRQLIESHGSDTAVMSAHIVPEGHLFEDSVAATFSKRILSDLLRDSLAFDGLVFTDALNMAGAASIGSPAERSIRAIEAGADVLLMPPDPVATKAGIIAAVRNGRLDEDRIDRSVRRILASKEAMTLHSTSNAMDVTELFATLADEDTDQSLRFMARDAVTVLKDDALLPVSAAASIAMVSVDFRARNRGPGGPADRFRDEVVDRTRQEINLVEVDPRTWSGQMPTILRNAREHQVLIIADYTGNTPVFGWNSAQFLNDVAKEPARVVYVSFDKPWGIPDLAPFPDVILQSWDSSPTMAAATADVLFGLTETRGRLPVKVGDDWPRGSGLALPAHFAALGPGTNASLNQDNLTQLTDLIDRAIADSAFPTAALAVGRDLTVAHREIHGTHTFDRDRESSESDLFDLASLTKVISTTSALMLLVEDGLVDLDRPVADYLPAFAENGKGMITVRDLLSHTGGLIPFVPFHMRGVRTGREVRQRILSDTLAYEPGSRSRYSDFGPITLAWMTEEITGIPFDRFVEERVFKPLAMMDTGYLSSRNRNLPNAIPTETDDYFRFRTLQGEVHDETAWLLGGTAGHAGLFSTIRDLTRFAGMLSREGRVGDKVFLRPETIRHFTTAADPYDRHTRALGWDTKSMTGYSSAGSRFGPRSFGHTGFTGTSFWYDPDSHLYVILLTNRVHPTRDNRKHIPIRPAVADIAFQALETGLLQDAIAED